MAFPVIVLFIVFALIAVRQVGRFRLGIWHIMLGGAAAVLLSGDIAPEEAAQAINADVMLFLFGMFVVGEALHAGGILSRMAHIAFRGARTVGRLVLLLLFGTGLLSALLMNDTLAIIGTPLVLAMSRTHGIPPKLLLLTLAFAITTGSVMSPIGNPQNLLIAVDGGVADPFLVFAAALALPTLINLFAAWYLLKLFYRDQFARRLTVTAPAPIVDRPFALISAISLGLLVLLIVVRILATFIPVGFDLRLSHIALISAAPILIVSPRRFRVLVRIDWATLLFFAAMFVLMASVWRTGFFQETMVRMAVDLTLIPVIIMVGILLSQLISNVPFVALFLPLLAKAGASSTRLMALAAGSTIAGNLFILGAASNVIIIQNAEREGETLTFLEFARIGVPLTIVQSALYAAALTLI